MRATIRIQYSTPSWPLILAAAGTLVLSVGGAAGLLLKYGTSIGARPPVAAPVDELAGLPEPVRAVLKERQAAAQSNPTGANWGAYGAALGAVRLDGMALEALKKAIEKDPNQPRWPYYSGILTMDSNLSLSADWFETALRFSPDYAPAWLRLAAVRRSMGEMEKARLALDRALDLLPDNPQVLLRLAKLEDLRKNLPAARRFASRSARAGGAADAYTELARVARLDGAEEEAEKALRAAVGKPDTTTEVPDPWMIEMINSVRTEPPALVRDGEIADNGSCKTAISTYRRVLDNDPANVKAGIQLGWCMLNLGGIVEARELLADVTHRDPDQVEAMVLLGMAYQRSDLPDQALESFRAAAARKKSYFEAHYAIGKLLRDQAKHAEAAAAFEEAVELKPDHGDARYALGMELEQMGKHAEAAAVLEPAVKRAPNQLMTRILYAAALMGSGKYQDADHQIVEAEKLSPHHPAVRKLRSDWLVARMMKPIEPPAK